MSQLSRVLIIDRRCVIGTCVCRTLATQGCEIDIFAYPGSAALRSRYCHRVFAAPPLQRLEAFLNTLRAVMENERYDAIHICNESVLEVCLPLTDADCWKGLLLPERRTVQMLLSKNRTVRFLAAAGIATPRTLVPASRSSSGGTSVPCSRFGRLRTPASSPWPGPRTRGRSGRGSGAQSADPRIPLVGA